MQSVAQAMSSAHIASARPLPAALCSVVDQPYSAASALAGAPPPADADADAAQAWRDHPRSSAQ
jgi:hypothetical protein